MVLLQDLVRRCVIVEVFGFVFLTGFFSGCAWMHEYTPSQNPRPEWVDRTCWQEGNAKFLHVAELACYEGHVGLDALCSKRQWDASTEAIRSCFGADAGWLDYETVEEWSPDPRANHVLLRSDRDPDATLRPAVEVLWKCPEAHGLHERYAGFDEFRESGDYSFRTHLVGNARDVNAIEYAIAFWSL